MQFTYTASQPGTHQKIIIDMAMNGVDVSNRPHYGRWPQHDFFRHLKPSGRSR
ncbi:IS1-like element transposase [Escherichia coli]|uniref:IS1-like element transposase n=1 Tax=Escherichia coli TaxID=562 RepID=UPI003D9ED032